MIAISPSQKTPKTAFWTDVKDALPDGSEALYLIVQSQDGTNSIGFAWYRKDGNDNFAFTKENVTHWAPAPKFP